MPDSSDCSGDGLLVARAVADHLHEWSTLARRIHARLLIDGAAEAAEIIAQAIPASMRPGDPDFLMRNDTIHNVRVRVMVGDFTFTPPATGPWPIPLTTNASPHKEIKQ